MAQTPLTTRQVRDVDISKILITSNKKDRKVDIVDLISDVYYWESILQETVRASIIYTDTGSSVDTGGGKYKSVIEGLPLYGQENTSLVMKDSNGVEINLTLYVNNVKKVAQQVNKSLVTLDLGSKEFIMNEKVRINRRFDGKISDHIKKILTDSKFLNSKKKLDISPTANSYNFIGNNYKPLYTLLWLSKKAVPEGIVPGNSAGFFFWETSKGFNFKAIDELLSIEGKTCKNFTYTQSPDSETLPGFSHILKYDPQDVAGDQQQKAQIGTDATRIILINPVDLYYEVVNIKSSETTSNVKKAGLDFPVQNPEFNVPGTNKDFSRTQFIVLDSGTLPSGTTDQQISKSKDINFDPKNILNQSTMRYNQMFTVRHSITIVADFSLHAGDSVYIRTPENSNRKEKDSNEVFDGYYVIADLCHYISKQSGAYTRLLLVRDSMGKKGSPTYKAI